jgi:hypothetical protein
LPVWQADEKGASLGRVDLLTDTGDFAYGPREASFEKQAFK